MLYLKNLNEKNDSGIFRFKKIKTWPHNLVKI